MNKRFFKFARNASFQSTYKGSHNFAPRIGVCSVYKKSVVATAFNSNKTSPLQAKYNVYRYGKSDTLDKIHAEMAIIQKLRWRFGDSIDWSKIELYIYREYKDGKLAPSIPCPACEKIIRSLGIKKVHCTTENGYITIKYCG